MLRFWLLLLCLIMQAGGAAGLMEGSATGKGGRDERRGAETDEVLPCADLRRRWPLLRAALIGKSWVEHMREGGVGRS